MSAKTFIKQQISILPALIVAMMVGAISTTVVRAAIPDTSGLIHGCRTTVTGSLRVVDSETGGTCSPAEVPLNWNETGISSTQNLYHITLADGAVDVSRSTGIVSMANTTLPGDQNYVCLDLSFTPKAVAKSFTQSTWFGLSQVSQDFIAAYCPATTRDGLVPKNVEEGSIILY